MANVNWNGGKVKGRIAAKAEILHDDTTERSQRDHSNEDIDKTLTHLNRNLGVTADLTYKQKACRLDDRLDELKFIEGKGKNTRISMISVVIYPPDGLLEIDDSTGLYRDTPELRRWFELADSVWSDFAGPDNCVSATEHWDEQHWYKPSGSNEEVLSKPHLHEKAVPEVAGRISGNAFYTIPRVNKLNRLLEDMTQGEFGISYNTGKGKHPGPNLSVEDLKAKSIRAADQLDQAKEHLKIAKLEHEQADKVLEDAKSQAQAILSDADKREKQAQEKIAVIKNQAHEILDGTKLEAEEIRSQAQDDAQDIRFKANQFFKLNQEEAQKELKRVEKVRQEAEDEKAKAQAAQKQVESEAKNLYPSLIEAIRRRMRSQVESAVDRFSDPVKVAVMKAFDSVFDYFMSSGKEVVNEVVNAPLKSVWMKDPDNLPTGVNYAAQPNDDYQA